MCDEFIDKMGVSFFWESLMFVTKVSVIKIVANGNLANTDASSSSGYLFHCLNVYPLNIFSYKIQHGICPFLPSFEYYRIVFAFF